MMNLFFMATVSFVVPEFSRRRSALTVRQWTLGALGVSVVVGGVSALWGLVFLVLPDSVGRSLLGDTWDGVSAILAVAIVAQVLQVVGAGPSMMLRAMDRVPVTFALNAVESPLAFVLGVVGAVVDGAEGAVGGFAIAYALLAPFWWFRFAREARRLVASRSATEAPASWPRGQAPALPAPGGDDATAGG
jgi:O-antigen/teichoic acid export membrane protein